MTNNDIFISNQKRTKIVPLEKLEIEIPESMINDSDKIDFICKIKVNDEVAAKVLYSKFPVIYNKIVDAIDNWDTMIDLYKIAGPEPEEINEE